MIKGGLGIDGPVLLPLAEDLPFLARPLSEQERVRARALAARWGVAEVEESAPISVIGTGPDLNSATDNGLERAADAAGHARAGGQEPRDDHAARSRSAATRASCSVTFRAPMDALERCGLASYAREQYGTD